MTQPVGSRGDALTELLRTIRADETSLLVISTSPFQDAGRIRIEGERIRYTSKTPTTFEGCTRGADLQEGGTSGATHPGGARVYQDSPTLKGIVHNEVLVPQRSALALYEGAGIDLMLLDNAALERSEVTISSFTQDHGHTITGDGGLLGLTALGVVSVAQDADYTGTNVNTAQKVFNLSTNGAAVLPDNTSYFMEGHYYLRTTGATSHFLSILFGGTATFTSFDYGALSPLAPPTTDTFVTPSDFHKTDATALAVSNAVAAASHHRIWIRGFIRVNVGGTLIPQYFWSAAPGVAGVTGRGSFLKLVPMGAGAATILGTWS